jgi:hypothetical protein
VSPIELLAVVQQAGIRLSADGDTLKYDAPRGALTPALRGALLEHKATLLTLLAPVEYVDLKGGLVVPRPALQLALDLEERGVPLATDANHQFIVPTDARLTAADRAAIARWFHHLGAIIEYEAPELA